MIADAFENSMPVSIEAKLGGAQKLSHRNCTELTRREWQIEE